MDKESRTLKRHVRKSENLIFRIVFKTLFSIFALALQIVVFVTLMRATGSVYSSRFFIYNSVRIIAVVYILYKHDSAIYKLSWILFIMFMPVFGICVYILWGNSRLRRQKQVEIKEIENSTNYLLDNSFKIDEEIKSKDKHVYNMLRYIQNITCNTNIYICFVNNRNNISNKNFK